MSKPLDPHTLLVADLGRNDSPQSPSPMPGTIGFTLFAPYNEAVFLISSWNNWQRKPMTRGDDGWWRISADLPDGDHFYKFVVKSRSYFAKDQWLEVFDPYGMWITDDDKEQNHIWIKDGKRQWTGYQWRHDDKPLPTNEQLVIYELHVGDFSGGGGDIASPHVRGKFSGVVEKLDYLADLGINAVEIMPIKEFPGKSWGYNLRSLFAIDSSYGSPADFCRLVDECHARSMRVIVDGVYNHADADAPLAKIDYEYWFYRNNPDPPELQWGPKFNYSFFDEKLNVFPARKYVIDSILFSLEHYHYDGIRFDAARAIKDFNVMHEFTKQSFDKIGGRKPFFTVAEHVPEDPAIVGYPKGPMVAAWRDSFAKKLQAIATQHERDGADPWNLDELEHHMNPATNGYGSGNHTVNYITIHDHERIMNQLGEIAHTFGEAAFRRVKLAMALLMMTPGLPMIWMGQEFGAANPKTWDKPQPISWGLLANQDNKDLHDYTAGLIHLRRNQPALSSDHFEAILKDKDREIFAFKRWNEVGGMVVVIANLKDSPAGDVTIGEAGLPDGKWHEHNANADLTVENGTIKTPVGPSEVKIFIKQQDA
jgi:1,4-alpha-glucan branching enzyme